MDKPSIGLLYTAVDTINVQGNSRYTQEEIVAASGIEQGDNMFLINKFQVIDQMISQLTYCLLYTPRCV